MATDKDIEDALQLLEGYEMFAQSIEAKHWQRYKDLVESSDKEVRFNASCNPQSEYYKGPAGTKVDNPSTEVNEGFTMANSFIRQAAIQEAAGNYGDWYIPRRAIANAIKALREGL